MTAGLKDKATFLKALHGMQSNFLHLRQAPQEIIEPNEVDEEEEPPSKIEIKAKKIVVSSSDE